MQIRFIPQPHDHEGNLSRMGSVIEGILRSRDPFFSEIWFVSAFANQLGIVRVRDAIKQSLSDGARIHFIVGIDFHQTSIEALREVLALNVDCKIVKNRDSHYTFHPKIYLFEAPNQQAELFLGSSNLTEGGMYRNFEANIQISYDISKNDRALYAENKRFLTPFLNPSGPLVKNLTGNLIKTLIKRGDVVSERRRRQAQDRLRKSIAPRGKLPPSPFGAEHIPTPPPPPDYLSSLIRSRSRRRRRERPAIVGEEIPSEIPTVTAFYMHLPKLQGPTIPGEPRIPLVARDIAPDFWGWPHRYVERIIHRRAMPRHYIEWKPRWKVLDVDNPSRDHTEMVRMYEYKESKDFRFYSVNLVNLGADKMDIVRITKPEGEKYEFQCELAKRGSKVHEQWKSYCTQSIPNSPRKFGYAF